MTKFFAVKPQSSSTITKADILFAQFMTEHNPSTSVADHFTDLVKVIFPESEPFSDVHKFYCAVVRKMVIFPYDDRVINYLVNLEQQNQTQ